MDSKKDAYVTLLSGKRSIAVTQEDVLSASKTGVVTTTFENDFGAKGNGFFFQRNFTLAAATGSKLYILIDYTTYTNVDGLIFVQPPVFSSSSGPVIVDVYRDSDYAGGTAIEVPSNNAVIDNKMETTITQNPTGTTLGTAVLEYLVGSESTNQNSGGGSSIVGPPFILDNTGKTLVEITNNSGNEITFNYSQVFFEV